MAIIVRLEVKVTGDEHRGEGLSSVLTLLGPGRGVPCPVEGRKDEDYLESSVCRFT